MTLRLTVIGTGYLGAVHAACMAELGFEVLGVDVDAGKIAALERGESPFFEPGLDTLLRTHVASGRLRFSTSIVEAGEFGDVHFVCVGTPQRAGTYAADLSHVDAAVRALAPHLRDGALVVGKSTVPVGTAQRLAGELAVLRPEGANVSLAWNPEFLREGYAVADTLRPDRLVVGVADERSEQLLRAVYDRLVDADVPFLVVDFATAELVKTAANAFLATKISFINAMADVCDATGADVQSLATALGYDNRIGSRFLQAGLGFGGGCLPKDIRAFMARAGELGVDQALTFLREVDAINMRRRTKTVDVVRDLVGGALLGANIACLGATFKPDSDDVRDSPALNVAASLQLQGATVHVHDPQGLVNARRHFPTLGYAASAKEACVDADAVVLLTEWDEYRALAPGDLSGSVRQLNIMDARHALDAHAWRRAGWTYRALGSP